MAKDKMPVSRAKTAYGLLSEIKALILEEPKRYNQSTWRLVSSPEHMPACGTVCCVGGWIDTLKFKRPIPRIRDGGFVESPVFKRGRRVLGLTPSQAAELFDAHAIAYVLGLPSYSIHVPAQGTHAYAQAGAEHITRFQKKYAKQLKAKKV